MNLSRKTAAIVSLHSQMLKKVLFGVLFSLAALTILAVLIWPVEQPIPDRNQTFTFPLELVPDTTLPEEQPAYPVRLAIPVINVEAHIQHVGLTPFGAMDVPSNTTDVGWFQHGPTPGTIGSAVISGHFNGENNEPGVFARLNTLKTGDVLHVTTSIGEIRMFEVREVRDYDPGRADEVFTRNDAAHLNLITCEGVWDETNKTYSKRRVVFTDLLP